MTATFAPKMLIKRIRLPKSTIGDEIRKENVTPSGNPALVKPIKSGMDEQEQKGSQQGRYDICTDTMEPAQYPLASFRRKVTLNVGNYENQKAEQHRDF